MKVEGGLCPPFFYLCPIRALVAFAQRLAFVLRADVALGLRGDGSVALCSRTVQVLNFSVRDHDLSLKYGHLSVLIRETLLLGEWTLALHTFDACMGSGVGFWGMAKQSTARWRRLMVCGS